MNPNDRQNGLERPWILVRDILRKRPFSSSFRWNGLLQKVITIYKVL